MTRWMLVEPHEEASYVSPVSPNTSGTAAATGASCVFMQLVDPHALLPYTCASAMNWPAGSVGRYESHWLRSFAQLIPDAVTTFVAPVERTASRAPCIPRAV